MQYGYKVYMDSYVASNGTCFMVTWTGFQKPPLEIGLKQNQKIVELRTLATIIDFIFYFLFLVMVEEPHD